MIMVTKYGSAHTKNIFFQSLAFHPTHIVTFNTHPSTRALLKSQASQNDPKILRLRDQELRMYGVGWG